MVRSSVSSSTRRTRSVPCGGSASLQASSYSPVIVAPRRTTVFARAARGRRLAARWGSKNPDQVSRAGEPARESIGDREATRLRQPDDLPSGRLLALRPRIAPGVLLSAAAKQNYLPRGARSLVN